MRFMIVVKANKDSEAGVLPDHQLLAAMGKYNQELARAGVLLAGDGLQASSKSARVRFSGADPSSLIAGFWIFNVKSKEEAIERVKRVPFHEGEIEIRQIFEAKDFGPALTPELCQQKKSLRSKLSA